MDLLITATALSNRLPLYTHNVGDSLAWTG
jgi:predicted nucleic acid-binding protein